MLSPQIRLWKKNGLQVLLLPDERRVEALRAANAAADIPADSGEKAGRAPDRAAGRSSVKVPSGRPSFPAGAVVPPAWNEDGRPDKRTEDARTEAGVRASARQTFTEAPFIPPGVPVLPLAAWPEIWLNIRRRCRLPAAPAELRVVWTYAGLEEDLMGRSDAARQGVIRALIRDLAHPAGTHVFWCCALPANVPGSGAAPENAGPDRAVSDRNAGASMFWSGMNIVLPRVLLLFGSEARDALLLPRNLRPLTPVRSGGLLILQLQKPESLAADGEAYKRTLAFLQQYLRFCERQGRNP